MRLTHVIRLIGAILVLWPSTQAWGQAKSVLDKLTPQPQVVVEKTPDGLRVRIKEKKKEGFLSTGEKFTAPLIIAAEAKTSDSNIRLRFGEKGLIIFNWELNQGELRHHDPRSGQQSAVPNQGAVPKNTWVKIRWIISKDESRVEVDGVERASFKGDYAGVSGAISIGTYDKSVVQVKSLTVTPIAPDKPAGAPASRLVGPVEITVPSAPAANQPSVAPKDSNAIERPEFKTTPKRLTRDLATVRAMMVRIGDDGQASGMVSDIIATVPGGSRSGSSAGVKIVRGDADEMMQVALEEAVRAVTLRYPLWEPGQIELSFGEKFVGHAGPSAGTAFSVLMLSILEGFEIDPKCALTGDITVDWKVRKVGGVTAKLRGATLDECELAVIPTGNATAFADMAPLYGNSAIWDIQVFTASTVQEAVAVARKDRANELAEAIKQFAELRTQLRKSERPTLRDPATTSTLKHILELAPNHLSARQVLALSDGTAPKTLSASATIYQLSVTFYPFREILSSGDALDRTALPAHVTALARKRLAALRPIANKDLAPLVNDIAAFIEAMDGFVSGRIDAKTILMRAEKLDAGFAKLDSDPGFLEKLVREGY